ncbi:MAG: hypothetical protein JXR91_12240, partial [Deltaproteobacteria bacterium]|nr:hypothetical protein [Deltaproteobacteria bacterium]
FKTVLIFIGASLFLLSFSALAAGKAAGEGQGANVANAKQVNAKAGAVKSAAVKEENKKMLKEQGENAGKKMKEGENKGKGMALGVNKGEGGLAMGKDKEHGGLALGKGHNDTDSSAVNGSNDTDDTDAAEKNKQREMKKAVHSEMVRQKREKLKGDEKHKKALAGAENKDDEFSKEQKKHFRRIIRLHRIHRIAKEQNDEGTLKQIAELTAKENDRFKKAVEKIKAKLKDAEAKSEVEGDAK